MLVKESVQESVRGQSPLSMRSTIVLRVARYDKVSRSKQIESINSINSYANLVKLSNGECEGVENNSKDTKGADKYITHEEE